MSDETKNDLPVEESEITNSVLDAASNLLLDQTIPAPVRRGVEAFAKRLFTAVIVDPLERRSAEKWAETNSRIRIKEALTDEIIQKIEVDPEFPQRAVELFGNRILRERFSLEKTFGFAINILKEKYGNSGDQQSDNQIEEPISPDWFNIFEKEASQKSTEDMQRRFAQILAGEIEKSGSHSIKAVKALGDMDQTVTVLFQKLCSICVALENPFDNNIIDENPFDNDIIDIRVPSLGKNPGQNSLEKYGLSYRNLNILNEHGLIIADYNSWSLYQTAIVNRHNVIKLFFRYRGKYWVLMPSSERSESNEFKLYGVKLTNVGRELFHIVKQIHVQQYTQELKEYFKTQQLEIVEVAIERSGQNIGWRII